MENNYEDRWQQVDSTANVFLACYSKRDTRTMRITCVLKEAIDPGKLQAALNQTISVKDHFQVCIRKGIFWHYTQSCSIRPEVKEDDGDICSMLYHPEKKDELHYRVTYYQNRINFEAFHAICDGTGAIEFVNELVLNYLRICHPGFITDDFTFGSSVKDDVNENSYKKYGEKESKAPDHTQKAYHISGRKLPYDQLRFYDVEIPLQPMLENARKHGTTLTIFLSVLLFESIFQIMPEDKKNLPVNIAVPVNLRNYYPSRTARNFFNNIVLSHTYTGIETREELAKELACQLKEKLKPENVRAHMNYYQNVQQNGVVRAVPLILKEKGLKFLTKQDDKCVTAVISNLGQIKVPDEMKQYIDHYCLYCSSENLFMTVSSFGEKLVLNFISPYVKRRVIRTFVRTVSAITDHVRVDASDVVLL